MMVPPAIIPLPAWNDDWTTKGDAWYYAWCATNAVNLYIDAVNERSAVVDGGFGGFHALTHAVTGDDVRTAWKNVIATVAGFFNAFESPWFVSAYDSAGTASTSIDYTGTFAYFHDDSPPLCGQGNAADEGTSNQRWVGSVAKRRYPRWINTVTDTVDLDGDAAANGQHAMVAGQNAGGSNVGRLFTRTAGAWTNDTSLVLPDVITYDPGTNATLANVPYVYYPGRLGFDGLAPQDSTPAYFTPQFLNETRDLINLLVAYRFEGITWGDHGFNFGNGASIADAQVAYASGVNRVINGSPRFFDGGPIAVGKGQPQDFPLIYQLIRQWATPTITGIPLAGVRNFQVYFVLSNPSKISDIFHNSGFDANVFDDNGDGFSDSVSLGIGHSGVITSASYTGTQVGVDAAPACDPVGAGGGFPTSTARGYFTGAVYGGCNAVIRYDVSGGFAYTKFT